MEIAKKTLYNLLHMHTLNEEKVEVEPWQALDYRQFSFQALFDQLQALHIHLEKGSFLIYAENYDNPEELTEALLGDVEETALQDQVYLLLFELWRRLIPSKRPLSIFCDEMDYRISQYDANYLHAEEQVQGVLSQLKTLLEENLEIGEDPKKALALVIQQCANDIESFIYDFLSDQLDQGNIEFLNEYLVFFEKYSLDTKWFTFLKARFLRATDFEESRQIIGQLLQLSSEEGICELYFEILYFLSQDSGDQLFILGLQRILPLVTNGEEFNELLAICLNYYEQAELFLQKRQLEEWLSCQQSPPISPTEADKVHLLALFP